MAPTPRFILVQWVLFHDITPVVRRGLRGQIDIMRLDWCFLLWRPRLVGSGG